MIGRLYLVASLFFALNLASTIGLPFANVFEKSAYLVLAAAIILTRRMDAWIFGAMVAAILLVVGLGAATTYPEFSWLTLVLSLNQFVIVYALIGFRASGAEAYSLLRTTAWLPLACVISGAIGQAVGNHDLFGSEWGTTNLRLQGALNSAFLSGLAANGAVSSLLLAMEWRRLRMFAFVAINFLILILAGGRAALAVALIVAISAIFFNSRINPRDKAVVGLGGIIALPFAMVIAAPFVLARLVNSGDNGRSTMWAFVQSLIDRFPWTGIGFGHQYWATPEDVIIMTGSQAAHNDYLRITAELGYLGAGTFFLLLLIALLRAMSLGRGFNFVALGASAGFALLMHSDNALATPPYFPILLIGLLAGVSRPADVAAVASAGNTALPDARHLSVPARSV